MGIEGKLASKGVLPLNQPICIDNGSGVIKAGFSGEEMPRCRFQSCVGRAKYQQFIPGTTTSEYIGMQSQEKRGLLKLKYPIEKGIVTDWEDMERIWRFIWFTELKSSFEEHPILITESSLNPRKNRKIMAQILFEQFGAPSVLISNPAILSLYASGRTTGIVLDSGHGVSSVVPVYEGFTISNALRRSDVAGSEITKYLQQLLRISTGISLISSSETEIAREIKESIGFLKSNSATSAHSSNRSETIEYRLPDGQVIEIGNERHISNEIVFDPMLIGSEAMGLQHQLLDSLSSVDIDLRKELFQSVFLAGGTTKTTGFGARLLSELKSLSNKNTKIKIHAAPERDNTAWIGASIISNLRTFQKMVVTSDEYNEDPNIIFRKCL